MSDGTYTLYYDLRTSAFVPHVMLEELGVPYALERVDTSIDAHETPEFRAINANMLIPTLALPDGRTFGENGAILLMLGDRHPGTGLVPLPDDHDRPAFLHWLFALATTGHTTIRRYSYCDEYTTRHDALDGTREAADAQLRRFWAVLDHAIAGDPWFLPRGFGPLDIYTAMILIIYAPPELEQLFAERPALGRLHKAVHQRPSVRKLWRFYFDKDT